MAEGQDRRGTYEAPLLESPSRWQGERRIEREEERREVRRSTEVMEGEE
jgi:hypothetical protein